jgi:hypothetical protein
MTLKEKAKELFNRMYFSKDEDGFHSMNKYRAKQCALIAVDEILNDDWYITTLEDNILRKKYWQEVKQEIEKL